MSRNSLQAEGKGKKEKGKNKARVLFFAFCLLPFAFATACRYDMQDQPRYESYRQNEFFSDRLSMRQPVEGTVPRGQLRENKAFYTGKKDNINPNIQVETTVDASGNTLVSSFPNDIEEFPIPITRELVDRGQDRYNIYCIVCHGPVGKGDGMVVRRGYPQPPTYHDDRLRNAPVGHFYDVITNGWGRMNSYAAQVQPADRWAIVAYIRTLQISQDPTANLTMTSNTNRSNTNTTPAPPQTPAAANTNTSGGTR